MKNCKIPQGYKSALNLKQTQVAIKDVKDTFESKISDSLNLTRVSAPLFVQTTTGLNDNLNGTERPVNFDLFSGEHFEIVHSLAKWKRFALKKYGFAHGEGLYTDMLAIRRDEETGNIHSIFVDQWDWEKVIDKTERNEQTLKSTVEKIYNSLKQTQDFIFEKFGEVGQKLPQNISFISTLELEKMYPNESRKMREYLAVKEHGAVFIMGVGGDLADGEPHDGRAPDYDDWTLNGDIMVYFETLDIALELSSMGIRVDEKALENQLKIRGCEDRKAFPFHKALLNGELPYTIGGGIGQSRMCMFMLGKCHIGEVQTSFWSDEVIDYCASKGVELL
ncbi:MAG: aspartate--ammonia ligase [Clostridia bacterium]